MRALLVVLLFVGWGAGSTYWYVCRIKGMCGSETNISQTPKPNESPPRKEAKPPLYFSPSNSVAKTTAAFDHMRDSLYRLAGDGNQLIIIGQYYADEENTTSFDNLGLARAEEAKALFADKIDPGSIMTQGLALQRTTGGEQALVATTFSIGKAPVTEAPSVIMESERKATILFAYNSSDPILPTDVIDYLDDVSEKLKQSGETVLVTGHTDSDGSEISNKALGLKRAKIVKGLLQTRGVDASQVKVSSKGESDPVSNNDSAAGKKQNRRVEVEILEKK